MARARLATYRLQLHAGFGFADAAALADYLAALGVSHAYSSPILQATPGSTHGYDVIDPQRVSDELGGDAGRAALVAALHAHGLGLLLDIVPNHMAVGGPGNRWWWDVLANGPASRWAGHFDVDWDPPEAKLRNQMLVPILGDHYGREIDAGTLRLARDGAQLVVRYHEHLLPVAPRSLDELLAAAAARADSPALAEISRGFGALPLATATDAASVARRHEQSTALDARLAALLDTPAIAAALDDEIAAINADADRLHALLERQNYRLAYWRTAARELGYRRFFDISTLIGLRVEDEAVFADTHALVLAWLADGSLDGVRVDHPDGLRDPAAYFERLRAAAPHAWIVAEKILEPGERLRDDWPIDGTTGYDFAQRVGGLFVDPRGEAECTVAWVAFTGSDPDWPALVRTCKHLVMRQALAADVTRLTALLVEVCERHRRHRDYTRHELHEALRELIACLPVYRTYVRRGAAVHDEDRAVVDDAAAAASALRPDLDPALFSLLADLLLLRIPGTLETELALRVQQLSGPVMAKGVEDTALYRFNRLVALNEVGGAPDRFGVDADAFHAACRETQARWPSALLATETHDTKRSEDVRARLFLLSEIPVRWQEAVGRWAALTGRYRQGAWPDRNDEYLFYQVAFGAWPLPVERAAAYMEKAIREAKVHTSWTEPDAAYEDAVRRFVEGACGDAAFQADLAAFVEPLLDPWRVTALAQLLLKLTTPGVPDLYQGSELWDLSLVDPDNRRPVDYAARRRALAGLAGLSAAQVWERRAAGWCKLWVIQRALAVRRAQADGFGARGTYDPLAISGSAAPHALAFARGDRVVTVVPRLVLGRGPDWGDTAVALPGGPWRNTLGDDTSIAGGNVRLGDLLEEFPVALLVREE